MNIRCAELLIFVPNFSKTVSPEVSDVQNKARGHDPQNN
jgi:hypothetical protein